MQVGEAAKATGVSDKVIRNCEATGPVPAAGRRESNTATIQAATCTGWASLQKQAAGWPF